MSSIAEVEKLALSLPESQRALLAAQLLGSLPPLLQDDDEGVEEATRRNAELDAEPSLGISLAQLDEQIKRRSERPGGKALIVSFREEFADTLAPITPEEINKLNPTGRR